MTELRSGRIMSLNNNCQRRNLTPAKPRFQEQGRNRCFGLIKTDYIYNQQTLTKLTCKRCTSGKRGIIFEKKSKIQER